ncbi:MAG: hypothetical protein R2844_05495 [Caldilineales bacterium]
MGADRFWIAWGSLTTFGGALSFYAFAHDWPVEIVALGSHIDDTAWVIGVMLTSFVLLLFPTGQHVSSRWRWVGRVVIVTALFGVPMNWIVPGPMTFGPPIDNPFGLAALSGLDWKRLVVPPVMVLFLGILLESLHYSCATGGPECIGAPADQDLRWAGWCLAS